MKILNYKIGKWTGKETPQTFIAQKDLIRKYYKEIKFKNPKHLNKFKDAPVV